jgi:pilus assembly protein Flp/PilA
LEASVSPRHFDDDTRVFGYEAHRELILMRRSDTFRGSHHVGIAEDIMIDILRHYMNVLAVKTGKGQGLVEYALIIVLISIVSIVIMTTLGGSITSVFSQANTALTAP